MNWEWGQIRDDSIVAVGIALAFCTVAFLFGF
jgi:hypothetical protein